MAMLDEIFLDELVDDPEPVLVEEPEVLNENEDDNENSEQPPLNPSEPTEGAVRVEPKRARTKHKMVLLNPQKVTGPRGIQCVRSYFKNVKLKGKGHELQDLNTVMSHLEHWANRMYPRANFDDVLKRLETLGSKRPVVTFMKRIRLGMIEDMTQDSNLVLSDTEEPELPRTSDDIFDELLASQPARQVAPPKELTDAQRERMLRNRRLAEEKRQARLAAEAERKSLEEHNAKNLEAIEFQQALLQTRGEERDSILQTGQSAAKDGTEGKDLEPDSQDLEMIDFDALDQVVKEQSSQNLSDSERPDHNLSVSESTDEKPTSQTTPTQDMFEGEFSSAKTLSSDEPMKVN